MGEKSANNLGESDAFATVQWNVFVSEDVKCVCALGALLVWVFWVCADTLSQSSKLFGVGLVPGRSKARVAAGSVVL